MAKTTLRTECIKELVRDLKSGKAIEHQPKRNTRPADWYFSQPETIERLRNAPKEYLND